MSATALPVPVVFDMETRDPDDALTLCLLATHPRARLAAVTVNPGTPAQLAVVRELLGRLGVEVPVGARYVDSPADAVSSFHHDWLGALPPTRSDGPAHEILAAVLAAEAGTVVLTGAPLHNLRQLLAQHEDVAVRRWVAQGGFAGDNLVPKEHRLEKFSGRTTCESFNFGGDKRAALAALASDRIVHRDLVSKNVTHGITWDADLQERLGVATDLTRGVQLAREGMAVYLAQRPDGKLLHDPLAACAVLDRNAFTWAPVDVTYSRGQWGAVPNPASATSITLAVDWPRAADLLFGAELGLRSRIDARP
ncbi:nucleoside hydrolase [Yinghuangia sp. YIM S09857]|uniref:nucleoside hydrolase n=1 Tax=Yinghuangia sp. YIM S09857 TaxID=3436929 RepID=UPI003F52E993